MDTNRLRSDTGGKMPYAYATPARDLPGLIRRMKLSNGWAMGNLNAMILEKNTRENVVLVALHEGTEIVSYQANDSITFRVIEGEMEFKSRNTSAALGIGQVLTLNDKVKYRLKAREETVMIMSIAKDTNLMRASEKNIGR
ncbi:MAG: hypothetical protein AB9888_00645 [Bacteroidales bacterium]